MALTPALAGSAAVAAGLVLRRGSLATAGIALVGAAYALSLVGRDLDPAAGLVGGALFFTAELVYWALEPGAAVPLRRGATARRALWSLVFAVCAAALGTLLLGITSSPTADGTVLGVAGLLALALVVVVVSWLVHSLRPRDPVG